MFGAVELVDIVPELGEHETCPSPSLGFVSCAVEAEKFDS